MLRTIASLTMSCLLVGGLAAAQPTPEKLELWGGFTVVAPRIDSALTTSYVPQIDRYLPPLAGSSAGQAVQLTGGNTIGLEGGFNYFFSPHLGVQVFLDRDRIDVSGTNGDYHVLLNYTAMQPPDYVSRAYSYSRTDTACEPSSPNDACVQPTTGSLRQLTLGFDLVGRWSLGTRVNGELSAGLSYFDMRGDLQPLRYTLFEMGGHSTLFSQEYQLAYSLGPAHAFGFNAGGSIDIGLGRGVSLVADARYFNGPELDAPVIVTDVLNKDRLTFLQDAATVQQILHPPAVTLNPAKARILVGVKVRR